MTTADNTKESVGDVFHIGNEEYRAALTKQIEKLGAASDEEHMGIGPKLAGACSVTTVRTLLVKNDNGAAKLKEAELWLFAETTPQGGATGLRTAGTARVDDAQTSA